jgi:phosphoenolpyruvate carboxylase
MGSVAIGALAALIGVLSGQGMSAVFRSGQLSKRLALLEESVPELITRNEVQSAFQQVAQIEAQRMAQQQQQQQQQQIARQSAVFGGNEQTPAAMNKKINEQLAALGERMNQLNSQFAPE